MASESETSEAKEPPAQEDVPGVRGPSGPAHDVRPEVERKEAGEASTWGGEGGAGAYQGAPVISDRQATPPTGRGATQETEEDQAAKQHREKERRRSKPG